MNVLLAEAECRYDQVADGRHNGDFGTDRHRVRARRQPCSQPARRAERRADVEPRRARTIIVNKRSMASGLAAIDDPFFYTDKTRMVFGDSKKVFDDIVKAIE